MRFSLRTFFVFVFIAAAATALCVKFVLPPVKRPYLEVTFGEATEGPWARRTVEYKVFADLDIATDGLRYQRRLRISKLDKAMLEYFHSTIAREVELTAHKYDQDNKCLAVMRYHANPKLKDTPPGPLPFKWFNVDNPTKRMLLVCEYLEQLAREKIPHEEIYWMPPFNYPLSNSVEDREEPPCPPGKDWIFVIPLTPSDLEKLELFDENGNLLPD
jgi:hypothetical protein